MLESNLGVRGGEGDLLGEVYVFMSIGEFLHDFYAYLCWEVILGVRGGEVTF